MPIRAPLAVMLVVAVLILPVQPGIFAHPDELRPGPENSNASVVKFPVSPKHGPNLESHLSERTRTFSLGTEGEIGVAGIRVDSGRNVEIQEFDTVELGKITERFYIHTSSMKVQGKPFPSNGLIFLSPEKTILIDTPTNEKQTRDLLRKVKIDLGREITAAIITHSHVDRSGGMNVLVENGIPIFALNTTALRLAFEGKPKTRDLSALSAIIPERDVCAFFPGPGHTSDNIVVWFPRFRFLFGGCFIKSLESENLGNTKESNLSAWPESIQRVRKKCGNLEWVIPGHGKTGNAELIKHTEALLKRAKP